MSDDWKFVLAFVFICAAIYLLVRTGLLQAVIRKPTARCHDGVLSFSKHRCGTCSHHGGVLEFFPA